MTAIPIDFKGVGARLTQHDIDRVSAQLGLDIRVIESVANVEAANRGFLADGRPELLYEAHQFSILTGGQWDATHPNISSPIWDRSLYGAAGAHQYDRLAEAMALDHAAALKAATWGMWQELGNNSAEVGFASIDDFVAAMCESEGRQLDIFAAHCTANNLVVLLKAHDWRSFALRYNGPGQVNAYAAKLLAAYENGKFPPIDPGPTPPPPPPPPPPTPPPGGIDIEIPLGEQVSYRILSATSESGATITDIPADLLVPDDASICSATISGATLAVKSLALGTTVLRGADQVRTVSVTKPVVAHLVVDWPHPVYAPIAAAAKAMVAHLPMIGMAGALLMIPIASPGPEKAADFYFPELPSMSTPSAACVPLDLQWLLIPSPCVRSV